MRVLQAVLVASSFLVAPLTMAQATPSPSDPHGGFFRPSADPALTAIRPGPAPAPAPQASEVPATARAPALEAAEQSRKAEEEQMDRAEREHDRARARAAATAIGPPAVVSAGAPVEVEQQR